MATDGPTSRPFRPLHRRDLALRSREVTAELDLVLLKVEKAEAETREGAVATRDEETRLLQRHQVFLRATIALLYIEITFLIGCS